MKYSKTQNSKLKFQISTPDLLLKNFSMVFVSLIMLAGCHFIQHQEVSSKPYSSQKEISLMGDIKDGHLDMPFEQACLIASGVHTDKKMKAYLAKIDSLISRINQETDIRKTADPSARAKIIFDWLQKNANEGIYNDCYDIKDTLNLKVGNCLSYAIRFTILCRRFDIDVKNVFIPGHIYTMVTSNGKTHSFEHTHSDGIVKKTDWCHPQKRTMRDVELIAEVFLYKARNANNEMKYGESTRYCQQALICNPHDNRPVILLVDNYIAKKSYEEAFQCLDDYLSRHPDGEDSLKKTYVLLKKLREKVGNIN